MGPYRDGYGDSPGMRLLRALDKSFRLGRLFGVDLYLHWTIVLVPLILISIMTRSGVPGDLAVQIALITTVGLYSIIYSHEMGHIVAGWRYRIRTPRITLSPLGGLAHMAAPAPSPKAEIVISLAGPAVHLLWLAVCWPLLKLLPSSTPALLYYTVDWLVWINIVLMIFNLLPFFPMDGGRVLRSILAMRMSPAKATRIAAQVGIGGAVLFILAWLTGQVTSGFLLALIGINNLLACLQQIKLAQYMQVYGGAGQMEAWQSDPDAWKHGARGFGAEPKQGFFAKRRAEREAKKREAEAEANRKLDQELDRVLARVKEVGMSGLTPAERKVLERASKRK